MSKFLPAFLPSLVALAIASTLSSQAVVVRGEVEHGNLPGCYYCPGSQFVIKCSETPIVAPNLNLQAFDGMQTELTGMWNGSSTSPSITVTGVQVVAESFSIGGNANIGHQVHFTAHGAMGDLAINAAALGAGFAAPTTSIVLLLDPTTTVVLGLGMAGGNGEFRTDLDLPNNAALIGLRLYGQALIAPVSGAALYTSNPDCKVIS